MTVNTPVTAATPVGSPGNGLGHRVETAPTSEPAAPVRNLYQRLVDVRLALGGTIAKGGTAPAVMGGFTFVSWDDVADRIGTLLAENGVMVIPEMPEAEVVHVGDTRNGNPIYRATTSMEFEILNVDNPADRMVRRWKGQGDDGGDKALQKSCTSAEKYFLLKLFMLGGADDTDAHGSDARVDRTARTRADASRPNAVSPTPAGRGGSEYGDGDQCPFCAELGISSTYAVAKGGWNKGRLQCRGKLHDGTWANHSTPTPAADPAVVDATASEGDDNGPDHDGKLP